MSLMPSMKNHHVRHTGLREDVWIEPRLRVDPHIEGGVAQDAVAGNSAFVRRRSWTRGACASIRRTS